MRSSLLYCAALAFASTVAVADRYLKLEDYPDRNAIVEHKSKWITHHWTDKCDKIVYDHSIKPMVYLNEEDICAQHHKTRNPNAECDHKIDGEHRECKNKEHWALTIEEGPNINSRNYIKALKEAGNVKALFLVVGYRLLKPENAKVLVEIAEAGHEIGINTWSHKRLSTLTDQQIVAEIKWTEKAIEELTGKKPSKYVRPPFGNMDMRVLRIIEALGYKAVLYNADPKDYKFNNKEDNDEVLAAIKYRFHKYIKGSKKEDRGTISLHHSVGEAPTLVAKEVIEYIRGGEDAEWRNTFVRMSVCLDEKSAHAHKDKAAHEEIDRKEIKIVRTKVDHTETPAHKAEDDESSFALYKVVKDDQTETSGHKRVDAESKTEVSFAHNKVVENTNADHTKTSGRKHEDKLSIVPHNGPRRVPGGDYKETPARKAEKADEVTEVSFAHNKVVEDTNADHTKTSGRKHEDNLTILHLNGPRRMPGGDYKETPARKAEKADEETEFSFAHNKVVEDTNADHTKTSGRKHETKSIVHLNGACLEAYGKHFCSYPDEEHEAKDAKNHGHTD